MTQQRKRTAKELAVELGKLDAELNGLERSGQGNSKLHNRKAMEWNEAFEELQEQNDVKA